MSLRIALPSARVKPKVSGFKSFRSIVWISRSHGCRLRRSPQLESCSSWLHLAHRSELPIHLAALKPFRLEFLIGFHALNRLTKLVEVADGLTISIGIDEPLHSLRHNGQVLERISVPIQSFQIIPRSTAILRRCRPSAAGAQRNRM